MSYLQLCLFYTGTSNLILVFCLLSFLLSLMECFQFDLYQKLFLYRTYTQEESKPSTKMSANVVNCGLYWNA